MSDVPSEWVEKAREAVARADYQIDGRLGSRHDEKVARAVLAAVLPTVRRAVAEEIAAAIPPDFYRRDRNGLNVIVQDIARIAREIGERDG